MSFQRTTQNGTCTLTFQYALYSLKPVVAQNALTHSPDWSDNRRPI